MLKDGNVIDSVNRDQYNKANDAVKAVANQELVQTQKDELTKVDQTLKDKEKKAAEEKAAAEKPLKKKQNKKGSSKPEIELLLILVRQEIQVVMHTLGRQASEKVIQTCISVDISWKADIA